MVTDALLGLQLSNPAATCLPKIKTVIRRDWDRERSSAERVAIITGGGSGHEPAHVGYVGHGMLTAAVCGEIFASPTVDQVFGAIMAVAAPDNRSKGVLMIVKCYTGDRLNFGMAAEKARGRGIDVRMVVVEDDESIYPRTSSSASAPASSSATASKSNASGEPSASLTATGPASLAAADSRRSAGKAGRRGLAGTVLVHKIAGAAA